MKYHSLCTGLAILTASYLLPSEMLASTRLYRQPIRVEKNQVLTKPENILFPRSSGAYDLPTTGSVRGTSRRLQTIRSSVRSTDQAAESRKARNRSAREAHQRTLGIEQRGN